MPKKVNGNKAREWERERRERLNESFNLLGTLLPSYDPSVNQSKIDILRKAVDYISDLQKENRDSVKNGKEQSCWKQVRHLKLRVENLLKRIQQLVQLLQDAGISIPPEVPKNGLPVLSGRPPKWSNKIRQEDAATLLEKVKEKHEDKKKEKKASMNVSKRKVNNRQKKGILAVSATPDTNNTNAVLTTSKAKLSQVTRSKKNMPTEAKNHAAPQKMQGNKPPTVTQLLGLSLNDIDISPPVSVPTALPPIGNIDSCGSNLSSVPANTAGSNVTVLASNLQQVPRGFIVIPKANALPSTSKSQIPPAAPCFMVAPAAPMVSCNQNVPQPCVVMSSNAAKVVKCSTTIQQPLPIVICSTTSVLENIVTPTAQKSNNSAIVTNSHLLTAPIMATGIQTCATPTLLPSQGSNLAGLGSGTLILANGSILPIFPSPQTVSAASKVLAPSSNTQIVMSSHSNITAPVLSPNQSLLFVQNKAQSTSNTVNPPNVKSQRKYSLCLPKPSYRKLGESTKTTFANKVPISALNPRNFVVHPAIANSIVRINKRGRKSGVVRSSKRMDDKNINSIKKGTRKNTKNNSKKNAVLDKDDVQTYQIGNNCPNPETVKTIPTDFSIKENINAQSLNNQNNSGKENVANVNCVNSVEQQIESQTTVTAGCQNNRKRENSKIDNSESSKKLKYTYKENKLENTAYIPSSEMLGLASVTLASTDEQDSDSLVCLDKESNKGDGNSSKLSESNDSRSIVSICQTTHKNISPVDVCEMDVEKRSRLSSDEEARISHSVELNKTSSMPSNNESLLSCNATSQLCSNFSDNNINSTLNSSESVFKDSAVIKKHLNPPNNSSFISNNCTKTDASLKEEIKINKQDSYSLNDECAKKNLTGEIFKDLAQSSSDVNTLPNCSPDITAAKINQNSEMSSFSNNVHHHTMCVDKKMTEAACSQIDPASVNILPVTSQGTIVENKPSNISSFQTTYEAVNGDKHVKELSTKNTFETIHTQITDVNKLCEKSTNICNNFVNIEYPMQQHTKEQNAKETNVNNSTGNSVDQILGKTTQEDNPIKRNVPEELSSTSEFNTFSAVSDSDVHKCGPDNHNGNTENLDLGPTGSSSLCLSLQHNELSNDIFASLQVPPGCQNSESISPTAAFLLAFPLVSTSKVSEIIGDSQDDVGSDSLQGTSTLLQIGSLDSDHHTESIISRSPTFQNSSNTSKMLSQPVLCSKSTVSHQDLNLDNHQFLPLKPNNERVVSLDKTQIESVKFPASHDLQSLDKERSKNWLSLQESSHSETRNNVDLEKNVSGNLNIQSYTAECLGNEVNRRKNERDCPKERVAEESCPYNDSKDVNNEHSSPENVNIPLSQPTNTNVASFSVNQFVSSMYETAPKEHAPATTKHNKTLLQPTSLEVTTSTNLNFTSSTSVDNNATKNSNFIPTHRNSNIDTSIVENSYSMRKNVTEQSTMTVSVQTSNALTVEASNSLKHSLQYSSSDNSGYSSSHYGYEINNSSQNEKFNIPSFSVGHNSSNTSIVSWTTSNSMSTAPNTTKSMPMNQHCFAVHNTTGNETSQNNYPLKKQNKVNCAPAESSSRVSQTYHPIKQAERVSFASHSINKISEPFSSSDLPNTSNNLLQNQDLIRHYLTDPQKHHNPAMPNVNNTDSQGTQMNSNGKPSDEQQHRPWMSTPDSRSNHQSQLPSVLSSNSRICSLNPSSEARTQISDKVATKGNQFCSTSSNQNMYGRSISTTLPVFDNKTYTSNSFYSSHSVASQNSQANYYHSHPQNIQNFVSNIDLNNENKINLSNPRNPLNDAYSISWMQRKSNSTLTCQNEFTNNNFISSSLPTLIGDLALGTNYPISGSDSEHENKKVQSDFIGISNNKKSNVCPTGSSVPSELSRKTVQSTKNSDQGKNPNAPSSTHEFRNISSQSTGSTFLSVSQLVNQANPCETSSRGQNVLRTNNIAHQHQDVMLKKQNTSNSRSHQLSELTSDRDSKDQFGSSNSTEKDSSNQKSRKILNQQCVSFRTPESIVSLPHSVTETSNKAQPSQVVANNTNNSNNSNNNNNNNNNNNYHHAMSSAVTSLPHNRVNFAISSNTQASSSISSVSSLSTNISWQSVDIMKQHRNTRGCKASTSSYSAEALIGLNSSHVPDHATGSTHDSRANRVISLPPPVVSERFCHHQSYPPPSVTRHLQVPPPFTSDPILSSNYFTPVELQTHHHDVGASGHQMANTSDSNLLSQPRSNNQQGFEVLTTSASVHTSSGQCNGMLYSHSEFMPSVGAAHSSHSLPPPVSLPCNFLPDLGTNSSYTTGILSESTNPFLYPSSTIPVTRGSSISRNSSSGKENVTTLSSPAHQGSTVGMGNDSNQIISSLPLRDKAAYSGSSLRCGNGSNATSRTGISANSLLSVSQNVAVEGGICNPTKPKHKKRTSDSVMPSSSTSLTGLVDLGYLGMPPVISSPMLQDDSAFMNHSGGFLASGPQHAPSSLYSVAPNSAQVSFDSTPHSNTQSSASLSTIHSTNLTVNSGNFATQISRGIHLNNAGQPSTVNTATSSGNSLTNFNLSTIFPEINEKQVPNQTYSSRNSPKDTVSLMNPPVPVLPLPATAAMPRPPHPQPVSVSSSSSAASSSSSPASALPRQATPLLLSSYAHHQPSTAPPMCIPPPPPPPPPSVHLHPSVGFNNILNPTTSQMCQWR